jgi:hypothetical protein
MDAHHLSPFELGSHASFQGTLWNVLVLQKLINYATKKPTETLHTVVSNKPCYMHWLGI